MPAAMVRPELRITARGPNRSASRSPVRRATAMASAKTEKVSAVTNGPAPFHSRMSSADHSIIAPSIRSAPIGTRHMARRAGGGSAKPRSGSAAGSGSSAISRSAKKIVATANERLQEDLLGQEADLPLREGAPDERPRHRAEAPEGMAAGHDPPAQHPLGLAGLGVHRHLDGGDGQPAEKEGEAERDRVRRQPRHDEAEEKPRPADHDRDPEPEAPDHPPDEEEAEHRSHRHAEEAEGQRQDVEPERRLHVGDARKPDREADRVQREDHLQRQDARRCGGHRGRPRTTWPP